MSWIATSLYNVLSDSEYKNYLIRLLLFTPNTIQQDIHLNIRLAGNSSAGYSAGTILLPITQKIRHYGKNESYLTKWHTKGFQNIKLVSLYLKSDSCENSKCLHFPSVQMKHIVQNRPFFLIPKRMKK